MKYSFSDKISNLKPSAIREIFKYATDPSVISLSAGNPSSEAFPVDAIAQISNELLLSNPVDALQYSLTEGYPPLREYLKRYMSDYFCSCKGFDDLIITSGAQQVMDLATKALCNSGDTVICESPSFIGSLNTFRSYGVKLCGVPMEPDGINIEKLEDALKSNSKVRFIYTIPNFQNPSGITMSLSKRKALYSLAKKYSVLILEDNPYGEIRFTDETLPNIKSFDQDGLVIYAGTFSKVVSPGMRVGFCIAPKELIQKFVVCKQGEDVHTNIWSQMVINRFLRDYDFNNHLEELRNLYKSKAKYTFDLIDEYLLPEIQYLNIKGGFFVWCQLPDRVDMLDFCKSAIDRKVCVVPGNAFLINENDHTNCFRLNFSTPTDEQLKIGIKCLGELKDDILHI